MMKTRSRAMLGVAGCLTAAALVASGCGGGSSSSSSPGVTKTTVLIGSHQPLTGPAAPGYSEIAPAAKAFFDYLNAQGGVNGRKINLIYKDDGYNPTKTVEVVHQLVLQNKVFAIFGRPRHPDAHQGRGASSTRRGCPTCSWPPAARAGTTAAHSPYTFGWQPNYTIEGKILGQYIKQNFAGKKVGVFYQDDDFGQGGLAGSKRAARQPDRVGQAVPARR